MIGELLREGNSDTHTEEAGHVTVEAAIGVSLPQVKEGQGGLRYSEAGREAWKDSPQGPQEGTRCQHLGTRTGSSGLQNWETMNIHRLKPPSLW